jgi:hypothetical protein
LFKFHPRSSQSKQTFPLALTSFRKSFPYISNGYEDPFSLANYELPYVSYPVVKLHLLDSGFIAFGMFQVWSLL